jgi:hypothetical protein
MWAGAAVPANHYGYVQDLKATINLKWDVGVIFDIPIRFPLEK